VHSSLGKPSTWAKQMNTIFVAQLVTYLTTEVSAESDHRSDHEGDQFWVQQVESLG
jgi:hypothetical protein